jgi:hypothetical protein
MVAFSATASDYMLDWLVGRTTPPAVGTRYLDALNAGASQMTAMTGSANRIAIAPATYFTNAAAASSIANTAIITFTASSSGSATVNQVALYDAITAGNQYSIATVTTKTLTTGDSLTIPIGSLTFTIG